MAWSIWERQEVKEAKRSSSGFSNRQVHKSKKTYHGRSFFDKQLNSEYSPNAKLIFLGVAFIAILIGGFALSQGQLFHSFQNNPCHIFPSWSSPECKDPIQPIWSSTTATAFKIYAGNKTITTVTNCLDFAGNTPSCLAFHAFQANATLVAISNSTVGDLSAASKYLLGYTQSIGFDSLITAQKSFGYYLTTNRTVPHHDIGALSNYNPKDDPSVVLAVEFYCTSGCGGASPTIEEDVTLLRTIGQKDTLVSEETGGCGIGSVFLFNMQSISATE